MAWREGLAARSEFVLSKCLESCRSRLDSWIGLSLVMWAELLQTCRSTWSGWIFSQLLHK